MLIIEGTDLVGKSTLAAKFLTRLNDTCKRPHIYSHFSKLPASWDYFWNYLERASKNIVQDRFHLSEIAYAFTCRYHQGQTPLCHERYRIIDGLLRKLGSMTVVVTASDDWLEQQLEEKHEARGEMYNKELILKVNDTFKYLVKRSWCGFNNDAYSWLNDYKPDIDFAFNITTSYPDEAFIGEVLDAYLNRLELLEVLTSEHRRPIWTSLGI